jgi:hypothetical protein
MDLDQLIRDADPARNLEIDPPGPRSITEQRSARARRSTRTLALVASVAVVVAVVAVLLSVRGQRTPQQPTAPARGPTQPAWLSDLAARFAVLRAPARRPPEPVVKTLPKTLAPELDPSLAHRVALPAGTVWIFPTPTELCVGFVSPGEQGLAGAGCSSTAVAKKVGVHLSGGRRGWDREFVAGVVPNGISGVQIHHTTGPVITATVTHNAFIAAVTPQVTFTRAIHDRPPYLTNASGQTYGSEAGARPAGSTAL